MKQIKHICIISGSYPTPSNSVSTFVDQLVCAFADLEIKCTVISPNSISNNFYRKSFKNERRWTRETQKGNKFEVYCPGYISFSSKDIFGYNTVNLTIRSFKRAVNKEIKRLNLTPDIVYGHFIVPSGIAAADIGMRYRIPSFFAYGESSPELFERAGNVKIYKMIKNITGVISVSNENKRRLTDRNIVNSQKNKVFPNAIDHNIFYKRDKLEMREKFGYHQNDFIVAFVGHYTNRKGSLRLSEALEGLEGVKSIFIGSGPDFPRCEGILHTGKVPHDKISEMLNASDIFVLPTLNEGCCNAIVEAMACGLPIISSDKSFNDDILWSDNSIKVNPLNIDQIRNAIMRLKNNNDLRSNMSDASLRHATNFKIENRAQGIINFMESKINKK